MILLVSLDLTEEEVRNLAYLSPVLREEPRKAWTNKEYQEHARYATQHLIDNTLRSRK